MPLFLSFLAGAVVMMLEMLGFRLLAPWFGYSTYVWGSLIGVVMAALAAGYLLGGHLADRRQGLLPWLLAGAGLYVTAMVPAYPTVLAACQGAGLIGGSLLASLVLLGVPMLLLASVSPYLVGMLAREGRAGAVAGRIWAVSTAGSIAGTFLASFVLIPDLGAHRTLLLCAALPLLAGALGLRAVPLLAVLALVPWRAAEAPGEVFSGESEYSHVALVRQGDRLFLKPEHAYIHSVYDPHHLLTDSEWDFYTLGPLLAPGAREMLVLGMGGGTSVRQILHFWPGVRVTGVDVDPLVVQVARSHMALPPDSERLRVEVEDARRFLLQEAGPWDVVEVDLYRGGVFIPFHLATREFFELIRSRLRPGGVVVMNVNVPARGEPEGATMHGSVARTLQQVFPAVYACRLEGQSEMLFAFARAVPREEVQARLSAAPSALESLARRAVLRPAVPSASDLVLTDDRAPVERLSYPVAVSYR